MEGLIEGYLYSWNPLLALMCAGLIGSEVFFKIKRKTTPKLFLAVLNLIILMFLGSILLNAYRHVTIDSVFVSGLCIAQIAKTTHDFIMAFIPEK